LSLTYTAAAIQQHAKLIEDNISELKDNLANRGAVPDYQTYAFLAGKIEGLRLALELCDEAVRRLNES